MKLKTTKEVVAALGGELRVAALTRVKRNAVNNWINATLGHFPADCHHLLTDELKALGLTAPPELFRQKLKKK